MMLRCPKCKWPQFTIFMYDDGKVEAICAKCDQSITVKEEKKDTKVSERFERAMSEAYPGDT